MAAVLASSCMLVSAALVPLRLSPESFNYDVVVELTAPGPVLSATTASLECGWTNRGYSFYERGYLPEWPATGLPRAGGELVSDLAADHVYRMAADYSRDNVLLVEAGADGGGAAGELRLAVPVRLAGVSVLMAGAHGGGRGTNELVVRHADGSAESGRVVCPDWMGSGYGAYGANGRVDVVNFTFAQVNQGLPNLYTADLALTNGISPVTAVEVRAVSGVRTVVFAVSGQLEAGGGYEPLAVSGYSADVIVEAGAQRPGWLGGVTSASLEAGVGNRLRTFYERGYAGQGDGSGLPPAGGLVTNAAAADCVYDLAGQYGSNNVLLLEVDGAGGGGTGASGCLVPEPGSAARVRALGLLTCSAGGPTTNVCVVQHADGTAETNLFVSGDWMGTDPSGGGGAGTAEGVAFCAGGRVNLNTRLIEHGAGGRPWLYEAVVGVSNTTSAVTNVLVGLGQPAPGKRTVIFAMSGDLVREEPEVPVLVIRPQGAGFVELESSRPGRLESTRELNGAETVWTDEGGIDGVRVVEVASGVRFWRVATE